MEVGPLVVLGLMWVVLNALRRGGSGPTGGAGKRPSSQVPSSRLPDGARPTGVPARPVGAAPLDATQREGSQLEQLLRELGRTLDQAGQQGKRPTIRTVSPARGPTAGKPATEGESLVSSEGQSLELESVRGDRAVEDLDDEAERVVEQRRAAAEANLRPLSDADHQAFDQRILRPEAADKTAARTYTAKQLREAVVWREILGPPVSLRGEWGGEG